MHLGYRLSFGIDVKKMMMNLQTLAFTVIIIVVTVSILVVVLPFVWSGPNAIVVLFVVVIAAGILLSLTIMNDKRYRQ